MAQHFYDFRTVITGRDEIVASEDFLGASTSFEMRDVATQPTLLRRFFEYRSGTQPFCRLWRQRRLRNLFPVIAILLFRKPDLPGLHAIGARSFTRNSLNPCCLHATGCRMRCRLGLWSCLRLVAVTYVEGDRAERRLRCASGKYDHSDI